MEYLVNYTQFTQYYHRMFKLLIFIFVCFSAAAAVTTLPLHRHHTHGHPHHSLFLQRHGGKQHQQKGTDQPIGGNIWPVSIYHRPGRHTLKRFAVAIDSGSPALYIIGKGCDGCVTTPPNEPYDPTKSTTSKAVGQNYSSTYETCDPVHPLERCTISGPLYTDVVSLGGFGPVPIEIGVIGNQTSNFYQFQTVDGVMGMIGGPDPRERF